MASKPAGIGVIGLGWPGFHHSLGVLEVPDAVLIAAADLDAGRRDKYMVDFPGVRVHSSAEDLIGDPEVDAVVVALPNFLHYPVTIQALQAGRHVLCEKPPTLTLAEMEKVRDEAVRQGLVYAFGRQFRFDAAMMSARRAVVEGRLGRVYHAQAHWLRQRGIPVGIGGWFVDKKRSGGGALIDLGVHVLDNAWYLAGCPKPLTVSAQVGAYFSHTLPDTVTTSVDDSAFAFLRFEGDFTLRMDVAWAMNIGNQPVGGESGWCGKECLNTTLLGTEASLQVNPPILFATDATDGRSRVETPLDGEPTLELETSTRPQALPSFRRQMEDFVHAIQTGSAPTNDVHQAAHLMRMLDAIYESSRLGREVQLG